MEKAFPKREWFDRLLTVGQHERFAWLIQVTGQVQRVLSVGCWTDEPFALLWSTNASELVVVEKNIDYINKSQEDHESLTKLIPEAFVGRSMKFVNADITLPVDILDPNYFDLVFCEEVLYILQEDPEQLDFAVGQMVNSLKPKGVLIAIERQFGAEFKIVESFLGSPAFSVEAATRTTFAHSMSFSVDQLFRFTKRCLSRSSFARPCIWRLRSFS